MEFSAPRNLGIRRQLLRSLQAKRLGCLGENLAVVSVMSPVNKVVTKYDEQGQKLKIRRFRQGVRDSMN